LNRTRQLEQHVDPSGMAATLYHAVHHVHHPGILSTGCSLATRLVLMELGKMGDGGDDVGSLNQDDNGTDTEARLSIFQRIKIHTREMGVRGNLIIEIGLHNIHSTKCRWVKQGDR